MVEMQRFDARIVSRIFSRARARVGTAKKYWDAAPKLKTRTLRKDPLKVPKNAQVMSSKKEKGVFA